MTIASSNFRFETKWRVSAHPVKSITFVRDRDLKLVLAVAAGEGLTIWPLPTGKVSPSGPIRTIESERNASDLTYVPQPQGWHGLGAVGGDDAIRLHDLSTGIEVRAANPAGEFFQRIAVMRRGDGTALIVAAPDDATVGLGWRVGLGSTPIPSRRSRKHPRD